MLRHSGWVTGSSDSEWIGFVGDRHGRPAELAGNDHLSLEQKEELQRRGEERAQARGARQAVVVVDVYDNGEAVPQIRFPMRSTVDMTDRERVTACIAKAAEALRNW